MKMSPEDYDQLFSALMTTLKDHNLHPYMVKNSGLAWQVFLKAWNEKRIDGNALYKKYNDNHITTAMNRMFKRSD